MVPTSIKVLVGTIMDMDFGTTVTFEMPSGIPLLEF